MGGSLGRPNINDIHANMFRVIKADGAEAQTLEIKSKELVLYSKGRPALHWPLDTIRSYGVGQDRFHFESGRRGPEGYRFYVFKCLRADRLFATLKDTIRQYCEQHSPRFMPFEWSENRELRQPWDSPLGSVVGSPVSVGSRTETPLSLGSAHNFSGGNTLPLPSRQYENLTPSSRSIHRWHSLHNGSVSQWPASPVQRSTSSLQSCASSSREQAVARRALLQRPLQLPPQAEYINAVLPVPNDEAQSYYSHPRHVYPQPAVQSTEGIGDALDYAHLELPLDRTSSTTSDTASVRMPPGPRDTTPPSSTKGYAQIDFNRTKALRQTMERRALSSVAGSESD